MGTPRIMLRFSDLNHPVISLHNDIFEANGRAFWGLWLKSFEDRDDIANKLRDANGQDIYIADTSSKAKPSIYNCEIARVVLDQTAVNPSLVPEYYRDKISEVSIWFEVASKIREIDADSGLRDLLGVPTIYFLDYDKSGKIITHTLQRDFPFTAKVGASVICI